MERSRSITLTRRAFVVGSLAAIANTACQTETPRESAVATPTAIALPPADLKGTIHDYCKPITENSAPVAQAIAGTPVPVQEVSLPTPAPITEEQKPPAITKIEDINMTRSQILTAGRIPDPNSFQAVIALVGYEEKNLAPKIQETNKYLSQIFKDVDVEFSFLNHPMFLSLNRVDHYVDFGDEKESWALSAKINRVFNFHQLIYLINTGEYLGTSRSYSDRRFNFFIASGEGIWSKYLVGHEMGHALGLSDGYKADNMQRAIPSEELFTKVEELPEVARKAYSVEEPKIVFTGGVCTINDRPHPIYTFNHTSEEEVNLMKNSPKNNDEIEQVLREDGQVFDDVQINMMNQNVRKVIALD